MTSLFTVAIGALLASGRVSHLVKITPLVIYFIIIYRYSFRAL